MAIQTCILKCADHVLNAKLAGLFDEVSINKDHATVCELEGKQQMAML